MGANKAAILPDVGRSLEIQERPYPEPADHEIVIRNQLIAINPVDWKLQSDRIFPWLEYPTILGCDAAGEVVQVGKNVKRFKPSDRVFSLCVSMEFGKPSRRAFQEYIAVDANLSILIQEHMKMEEAVMLPLCVATAACGLYQKEHLGLQLPSISPKPTGEALIVWGGASSVGVNTIQLAKASGYEVYTTASPQNSDYLKRLGATEVFDYHSKSVAEDIVKSLQGKRIAGGYLANGNLHQLYEAVSKADGPNVVANANPTQESPPEGMKMTVLFAATVETNEVGTAVFVDYLPQALARGKYQCAPRPNVVGHGLGSLQKALDLAKSGVSAEKILVTM